MKQLLLLSVLLISQMPPAAAAPTKPDEVTALEKAAGEGNSDAMTELGLRYHEGRGVKQDHGLAYEWYLKAAELGDGDAFNNLGVLLRDGLGVPRLPKVAYLIFLAIHMEGIGNEGTQGRAGRSLDRLVEQLPKEQIHEALSYTWPYVQQIVKSRGRDLATGPDVLPTKTRPRIRDNDWWLDHERAGMTFKSPPPWDEVK
jgi:hypothetical protein